MSGWMVVAAAVLSAVLTCVALATWTQYWLRPRLMKQLDEEFRVRLAEASDVLAERVEDAVRRGVIDGVTRIGTREVIEGATRNIARTGAGLVEDSLGRILGRQNRRSTDPD